MLQGIFMHSLIMHLTWLVKSTAAFLKPYLAALKTYQVILQGIIHAFAVVVVR